MESVYGADALNAEDLRITRKGRNWFVNEQGARLLHVVLHMKEEFVLRDRGHHLQNEKKRAARSIVWGTFQG